MELDAGTIRMLALIEVERLAEGAEPDFAMTDGLEAADRAVDHATSVD